MFVSWGRGRYYDLKRVEGIKQMKGEGVTMKRLKKG